MSEPAPIRDVLTLDQPAALPHLPEASPIISMIERAARDPAVDIDKLERLMAMQERMTAQRASAAFSAAFAEMQRDLPAIEERGKIDHGRGDDRGGKSKVIASYALWEDINDTIKPVLAKHGFGLRFEVGRVGDRLSVTGVLMHREGHSERTTMELPADGSGSKNAVQAVGSSTSYGKRYVASALLNLTSRLPEDRDDDGKRGGGEPMISDEEAMDLRDLVEASGANLGRFLAFFKVDSLAAIPAKRHAEAVRRLQERQASQGARR